MKHNIELVKIEDLAIAPENARKSSASEAQDASLRASLVSSGRIYVPLVAYKQKGTYMVCAGGRRTTQLKSLLEAGELPKSLATVPVSVIAKKDATDVSLIENVQRAAMSPYDTAMAIGELRKQSKSDLDIAATVGQPLGTVRALSRFCDLPEDMRSLVRKDEIAMPAALHLCGLPDERVMQAADHLVRYHVDSQVNVVKRLLSDARIPSSDRRIKFVGLDAYVEAGGAVERDLVDDDTFATDSVLLNTLFEDKLATVAEINGLSVSEANSAETSATHITVPAKYSRVPTIELPKPEFEAEYDALSKTYDAATKEVAEIENGELEVDQDRWDELQDTISDCYTKMSSMTHSVPDPDLLEQSHRVVYVDNDGQLCVTGFLPPKTEESTDDAADDDDGDVASSDDGPISTGAVATNLNYTHALSDDLLRTRGLIKRNRIAADPALAYDLMAFTAALDLFGNDYWYGSALSITFKDPDSRRAVGEDFAFYDAAPYQTWFETADALPKDWIVRDEDGDVDVVKSFVAFRALPKDEKDALFAFGVACSQQTSSVPEFDAHLTRDVDFAEEYRPDRTFFNRVNRSILFDILGQINADEVVKNLSSATKAAAVDQAHRIFTGVPTPGIDEGVYQRARRWVPTGIRYVEPSEGDAIPDASWLDDDDNEDDAPTISAVAAE